ncbi:MAG: hypothetical protein M3044_19560 [Thermoproteota archaeon]|nr:hypothetical protein [Thermoproteota archaeon]
MKLITKATDMGYIHQLSLKSIKNSSVLAALTFVDISGALIGAVISVSLFVALSTTLLAQLIN